jgi:hypothetical protein
MAGQGTRPSLAGELGYSLCVRALLEINLGSPLPSLTSLKRFHTQLGGAFAFRFRLVELIEIRLETARDYPSASIDELEPNPNERCFQPFSNCYKTLKCDLVACTFCPVPLRLAACQLSIRVADVAVINRPVNRSKANRD